jgi:hypothetical protein
MLLVDLYYSMCTMPGMPLHIVATCSDALEILTRSKNKLSIQDIRLPWLPTLDILRHDLFLTRRQFEVRFVLYPELCMQFLADLASTQAKRLTIWGRSLVLFRDFSIRQLLTRCSRRLFH